MSDRLLTGRDAVVWAGAFAIVAALLVLTRFSSDDPDSALYAGLSARLAQERPARWIAPEWWDFWPHAEMTGLFREHPAGVLLLPTAMTRLGIPAEQGAYVVGIATGLGSLVLIGILVHRLTGRDDGRLALLLLQLMPVAFIFRIRANHEYPMLFCLVLVLWGLELVRRSWSGVMVVAVGMTAALLIKGVFVIMVLIGAGLWLVLNPTGDRARPLRPWIAVAAGLAAMLAAALAYDAWYASVTGEAFWLPYWQRQLGPVTLASPLEDAWSFTRNFLFYASRLVWHPAPWSIALIVSAWQLRGRLRPWWQRAPPELTRGLVFALGFALLSVLVLTPSSRFAERYAFSATFAIGAAGVVAVSSVWPRVGDVARRVDAAVPAAPAVLWFALMLLRLVTGPILPRF